MAEYITQIDFNILYWIQENLRCAFLDILFPVMGEMQNLGIFGITVGVILLFPKKTRFCGFAILVAMLGTLILEYGMKFFFTRVRPCNQVDDIVMLVAKPASYSFPSNHAASSFAAAVAVLMTMRKKIWAIPAFVIASLISFARIYCFVHFPSDVIVGAILGSLIGFGICLLMDKSGFKKFLQRKNIII